MFEINRTHARAIFKDLLGQANHFLITILIGLNSVRVGDAGIDDEFRTSWNPRDVKRSADRSRSFALDLALIRAVDSLDAYMLKSRRSPLAIRDLSFTSAMDGTGQKIARRLDVFNAHLGPPEDCDLALLRLAIDWRNRRVHSLSRENVSQFDIDVLNRSDYSLRERYRGLVISELIARYKLGDAPTFKEAASIIRLAHRVVEHFDGCLLRQLDVDLYVRDTVASVLNGARERRDRDQILDACNAVWGPRDKKQARILRILRLAGVVETPRVRGRQVPDGLIAKYQGYSPKEAFEHFSGD